VHRSPAVRTLVALAASLLTLPACGGAEGPITVATDVAVTSAPVPPATDPVPTTVLPTDPSTTSTTTATSTTVATTTAPSTTTSADPAGSAVRVLAALVVAAEQPIGYDRGLFVHWIDSDGDGCDARAEVLIAESLGMVQRDYPCHVVAGDWFSTYDGATWTDAAELDIDHVVALAEAWRSGAWQWSAAARQAYANDLTDERTLIAVTDSVNQSKSDDDPSQWLPPRGADTCRYVGDWLAIKWRWGLTIDPAEHDALARLLDGPCNGLTIAPVGPPPVSTAAVVTEIPSGGGSGSGSAGGGSSGGSSGSEDVYYANCAAVRAAGMDPLYVGDPGYRSGLDRDGDGVACE